MKYLGIDWGLKRIGLAVSEGKLATPFLNLEISGLKDGVEKVVNLIKKENVELIILGKPEGKMGKIVDKTYQAFLKKKINIKLADETLSTHDAKKIMLEMGFGKNTRKNDNACAAALILQRYLDEK
ncbi:MAG: Holliday junction resolvase RuvX [Candidatus Daviesbacteria bacterium]|nr:Holliday junction resolvase RuvX [Candidatus Daviesbacteria bacterium]